MHEGLEVVDRQEAADGDGGKGEDDVVARPVVEGEELVEWFEQHPAVGGDKG